MWPIPGTLPFAGRVAPSAAGPGMGASRAILSTDLLWKLSISSFYVAMLGTFGSPAWHEFTLPRIYSSTNNLNPVRTLALWRVDETFPFRVRR